MVYAQGNPKTKKELKELVEAGRVEVFQPGPFGPGVKNGKVTLEGPHYPAPHKWYATAEVRDGYIVKGTVR